MIQLGRIAMDVDGPRRVWLVAAREARADRRQPDGIVAALAFMAVLVLLTSLVVGPQIAREPGVAPALFWIALLFTAMLAAQRSFERELADDAIDAVIALPGGREALYAGKLLALTAVLALVAVAGGLLEIVFLDLGVALPGHLALAVVLGILALPPVVVLDVALTLRLRGRGALVPVLALPVLLPQLVSATNAATAAIAGDAAAAVSWSLLLVAIALIYTVLGLTIVPTAIE